MKIKVSIPRTFFFCLAYLYPLLILLCGQGGYWLLVVPVFTFVAVPILDILFGIDLFNPDGTNENALRDDVSFRLITWIWVPLQLLLIDYGFAWARMPGHSVWEIAGMVFAIGLTNGIVGITFAHELMHKSNRFENFLALVLMSSVSYPHFCIEHVFGHHKNVATRQDPATARFGESFYQFYPRAVFGSYASAWNIELDRLSKRGQHFVSLHNRMLCNALVMAIIYLVVYCVTGLIGVGFFFLQGLVAFTTLEIINYMEHYGLRRAEVAPGVYERVLPRHSWNSGCRISNWFLLNLARHSDHHCVASKRYQILRHDPEDAPQLPFGYGTMYTIALVPPLWFALMNQRALKWQRKEAGNPSRAA